MVVARATEIHQEEGSLKVHRSRSVRRAKVMADGKNLVSHAGAALLAELADRTGLTKAMSVAMEDCGISWHTHDPGVVLTHLGVAMADGADCLADIAALKEQEDLFGPVASVATAWRAVHATMAAELRAIPLALASARERVWAAAPPLGPMIWDFDSTLLNVHSEKEDAAPTYKHGFGFNPLAVWCDNTNEPLAAMLRPGNAAPNDTDDHLELLEQAVRAVPPEYATGHEEDDDPALVLHPILVRADSAGATHRFVESLTVANFDYSIGFPISGSVRNALLLAQEEDWVAATELDGGIRDGAEVIELTELYEVKGWPEDMRVICRRERPHPGAQLSLFDTSARWRHTCFITNTKGDDITALELRHRGHARVEDRVRCWKACGLAHLPFDGFCANEAWVAVSLLAGALLAWSQMTCFDGALAKAEPKTMRYRVLHVAAVLARRGRDLILRLDETWPWASELATAFRRLRAAFP
jgi:Transposase DDE domain group 1